MTTTGDEGSFLVTTDGKSVVLSQFTPTVWPSAPVVNITPTRVTTNQGGATVFTANVTSTTSCRYQWRFNGSPIAGATTPTMNVYNQPKNAGSYDVVVINPGGTAVASPVTLTVTPVWDNPAALIYHLDQTPVAGAVAITDATGQTRGTMVGTTLPLVVSGALAATSNAWDFTSASAYLSVTSNPVVQSLGDYNQTPGLSFSFWVKMTNNLNNASVCALRGLFKIFGNGNGLTYYAGGDLLYNPLFSHALASIEDGNWHHVVFTTDFRNNSGACYLDGVSQGALTVKTALATSTAPNLTSALNIGADAGGANQWKSGLDEFSIYTRCLSAAEVTQLYNASGITTNAGTTNYCALANPAPTVGVGATRMLIWTNGASSVTSPINAAASDLNGGVTYSWSTRTTPTGATVNYGNNTAASTTATLSAVGTYVLRCTVTDGGGLTDYDELTLIVASNQPPSIGVCQASQNILLNTNLAKVNLSAVVLDDGLPLPPGIVTSLWTQVSGPAPVSFLTPWLPNTPVTIPTIAGNYVLQLVAGDGLAFATPAEWQPKPARTMLWKVFGVPKADGDTEDGEVTISSLAANIPLTANVERWCGQFELEGGKPCQEAAQIRDLPGTAFPTKIVEIAGGLKSASMTGPAGAVKAGWRMLVVEVTMPGKAWYLKFTGPAKTVAKWQDAYLKAAAAIK